MPRNAFYAQSGGVTAVINASAAGVIETARKHRKHIGKVYAGRNGILGALNEELIDTSRETSVEAVGSPTPRWLARSDRLASGFSRTNPMAMSCGSDHDGSRRRTAARAQRDANGTTSRSSRAQASASSGFRAFVGMAAPWSSS